MFHRDHLVPLRSTLLLTALILTTAIGALAADLTIDDIVSKTRARFDGANTVSVTVSVQMADPTSKKPTKMGMSVLADKAAGLSRMTFTSPAAFKGQIIIVDQKAGVMKMYMPVTNQVMVTKLAKAGVGAMGMGGMNMDFTSSLTMPDKSTHDIKLLGREKVGSSDAYVVLTKEKKDTKSGGQRMWLATTDFTPLKLELLDTAAKSLGTMEFKDLKFGMPIDRKKLTALPAGVEVIEG